MENNVSTNKLVIHCCHHKTGTMVMTKILHDVCKHFNLKLQSCSQKNLRTNTDVWIQHHSRIDFSIINRPIIGTHMIRNPYSIIISAYEYHKITTEKWANQKIKNLNNITYKEALNRFNKKDGIYFEMANKFFLESSRNTINDIYNWNYNMPNFLETKYEDLMTNFNETLTNMFKHYEFTVSMIDTALKIAEKHNINLKNPTLLKNSKHITNISIDLNIWKTYFTPELKRTFLKIYPRNIFSKIGYYNDLDDSEHTEKKNETN